jgi:hypothetical protein
MEEIKLQLTIDETNLILDALGQMPYARVFQLINKIQHQAQAQLSQSEPDAAPPADE